MNKGLYQGWLLPLFTCIINEIDSFDPSEQGVSCDDDEPGKHGGKRVIYARFVEAIATISANYASASRTIKKKRMSYNKRMTE